MKIVSGINENTRARARTKGGRINEREIESPMTKKYVKMV